jgi:hypothetical protein
MVLYLCVLIVFSLRRELLKLILVMNPSPRWFSHTQRSLEFFKEIFSMPQECHPSCDKISSRTGKLNFKCMETVLLVDYKCEALIGR